MDKNLILVVDDENDICAELSIFLSKEGFNVVIANNVPDAVKFFHSREPVLVITDYNMPGENGIDLLRKVKSINPVVNVILVSGVADLKIATSALKEDAFDFIQKPIDLTELELVMRQAIARTLKRETIKSKQIAYLISHKEIIRNKPISILYFNSSLDDMSYEKYKTEFNNLVQDQIIKNDIIIDLKYVKYINNIGLNLMIYLADLMCVRGLKFCMCNPTNYVYNYINTLGYSKFLNVELSQEDAIAKLYI
jgi:FixJ family two-component response regulator/anti-anti-sigma regulatory factor